MPFTPFHFGLGALAKAVAPTRISFAGFALSQVVMDLEPGIKMLTGSAADLHIITHNAIGASLIAFATLGSAGSATARPDMRSQYTARAC